MLLALIVLSIFHPGRSICGPGSKFPKLTKAEKKEMKARRKAGKAWRKEASYEHLDSQEQGFMAPNEEHPMDLPALPQNQYNPDYTYNHSYSAQYPDANHAQHSPPY